MTKKHYEAIAGIIEKHHAEMLYHPEEIDILEVENMIDDICAYFKADNPKFNRDRFLAACGITE